MSILDDASDDAAFNEAAFNDAIAAIDRTVSDEAIREARKHLLALKPATAQQEWRVKLRRILFSSPLDSDKDWTLPLDERAIALDRLIGSPHAWPEDAERAALKAMGLNVARRRREASFAELDAVQARAGRTPRVVAMRARLHMAFDERAEARAILEEAVTTHPGHHVHSAYASLLYVVADFDGAAHYARLLEGTPYAIDGADLLVGIAASRGDLPGELDAITRAIDIAPQSEHLAARLAHRAVVAASLDDLDSARADLERALEVAPPDIAESFSVYVRHRLDALDAAGPDTKHRRLPAFPTVLQKWNYCGPAVIELCLRYLGLEMTQEIIAEAVKKEDGTPMLAIVEFLREQGIEARRVEATPERLRAAINLGVPVILEDDHSNTLHVTVAMGYDDRLGVLLVADPMTHAPLRQGIESRDALAGEHRYGGIAVLGHTLQVTDDLRRALDEVGLVERDHIALLDELSRERDDISPAFSAMSPLEAGGRAREALALEPRFARAAAIEAHALLAGDTRDDVAAARAIVAARRRFPELSEFASLASQWNEARGNGATAIGEAVLASVLDPASAQPRASIAWNLTATGDRPLAYRYANEAFVRAPAIPGATLALARVTVDDAIERARTAGTLGSAEPAFMLGSRDDEEPTIGVDDATALDLARRLTEAAVDMAPDDPVGRLARGDLFLVSGDLVRAREEFAHAIDKAPGWSTPHVRLAHVLESQGDPAACGIAIGVVSGNSMPPEGWSATLELIGRRGTAAQLVSAVAAALDSGVDPETVLGIAFKGLARLHRSEPAAARAVAELAHGRAADTRVLYGATDVLKQHGLAGYATDLLRARMSEAPHDAQAHFSLASILASSPSLAAEALHHAERAYELAPWAPITGEQLGWMVVDASPSRALEIAEPYGQASVGLLELRRFALVASGRANLAQEVEASQVALAGDASRAQLTAALDHVRSSRYTRVATMNIECEPRWDQDNDVRDWLAVQFYTGHIRRAVALIEAHGDVAGHRAVADFLARLGPGIGPELVAAACRRSAAFEADPHRVAELEVRAKLALHDADGLEAAAGDSVAALVACAESGLNAPARLQFAERAAAFAPQDRTVLAALHAALFDNGRPEDAAAVARQLHHEYPFHHQGPERMAEVEAFGGDRLAAVGHAAAAVAGAPYCSRAHAAYAIAAAVAGEWEQAGQHAAEAARWNTDSHEVAAASPDRLVLAASAGDARGYAEAVAALRRLAPSAKISRLEHACAVRIEQLVARAAPTPPAQAT